MVPGRHGDHVVVGDGPPGVSGWGLWGGRLCALGGAVVTVEVDVDAVERRLAAGELSCPACSSVLAGWGRARPRQPRPARAGAAVFAPGAGPRLGGGAQGG